MDGLARDVPRLAHASGCGFQLEYDALPVKEGCTIEQALDDGEDYELLIAVQPEMAQVLQDKWPSEFVALSRIGQLIAEKTKCPPKGGWDHFG